MNVHSGPEPRPGGRGGGGRWRGHDLSVLSEQRGPRQRALSLLEDANGRGLFSGIPRQRLGAGAVPFLLEERRQFRARELQGGAVPRVPPSRHLPRSAMRRNTRSNRCPTHSETSLRLSASAFRSSSRAPFTPSSPTARWGSSRSTSTRRRRTRRSFRKPTRYARSSNRLRWVLSRSCGPSNGPSRRPVLEHGTWRPSVRISSSSPSASSPRLGWTRSFERRWVSPRSDFARPGLSECSRSDQAHRFARRIRSSASPAARVTSVKTLIA